MLGLTENLVRRIKEFFSVTGLPCKDMRGRHKNRKHAFSAENTNMIVNHIKSFRGRSSHYARTKSTRLYLPEDLNILKMYCMFKEKYPLEKCAYESYRKIFNSKFNISFGYPRKDTCSFCDLTKKKITAIDCQVPSDSVAANDLLYKKNALNASLELHQRKAEMFYQRKRTARLQAQQTLECSAICFDFQKNLKCPNISTQDVYYSRQLSFYSFNIHILSSQKVHFYCYDETVGNKSSDDVCSMLHDFFTFHLPENVKHIKLFCDSCESCAGQNKNRTVLRFFYYLVHKVERFDSVTLSYPIRGHSYMECDRDMAIINQKSPAETPEDWRSVFRASRKIPEPFNIINMAQEKFLKFTEFLKPYFLVVCPFKTCPIREVEISKAHSNLIMYRENWSSMFSLMRVTSLRSESCSCSIKGKRLTLI
ncbi:uncharacterized protein LOC124815274 [Hydra vulgaris]|uniref:uncharacterized protein LOC124815274 n=1 Tax=Hydra vulgaris TaxID=6087 RepID=UPI001F5EACAC|nr:uncharacterized protein LOC124815274 [Hydra vulgaris]